MVFQNTKGDKIFENWKSGGYLGIPVNIYIYNLFGTCMTMYTDDDKVCLTNVWNFITNNS